MSFVHFDEKRSIRHRFISPSWGVMRPAATFFLIAFLCIMPVSALEPDVIEESDIDVLPVEEIREVVEYDLIINQPITTIEVSPEDYYNEQNGVPYVTGSAYQGTFNSTALNYFTGVMLNNVGDNYVAFRGSQYVYYLFWGEDISYNGSRFVGSNLNFISYNSQNGTFDRGTDSLSIADNNTVVYSNVNENFAHFVEVRTIEENRSQGIATASIFILLCLLWLFKR